MLHFFIELFEVGVVDALTKFCFSGSVQKHLTVDSTIALTTVLGSAVDDASCFTKKRKSGPGESSKGGARSGRKVRFEGIREIVYCLPAIAEEELQDVKEAVEKARSSALKKGKNVLEKRNKGKEFDGSNKFHRLCRNAKGVPWQRRLVIEEPSPMTLVKQEVKSSSEEDTDSSCQILGETLAARDEGCSSVFVDLDEVETETFISDDEVQRRNQNLMDMIEQLPPELVAACPEFH